MVEDPNIRRLENAAEEIRQCTFNPDAKMRYDIMSDAVFWDDEFPTPFVGDALSLRLLLRYRTTLLIEEEATELRPFWDKGKSLFPNWPGFLAERINPSKTISSFIAKVTNRDTDKQMRRPTN
jgi:hypothetical protein